MNTDEQASVRIDIWLWANRIYKTRSLATQACKKGNVSIRDTPIKPSRVVRTGDEVAIKKRFMTQNLRVLEPIEKRVGAKVVSKSCEDLTSPEAYEEARNQARMVMKAPKRESGSGRPTKKDRRDLEEIESASDENQRDELFEKWIRSSGF